MSRGHTHKCSTCHEPFPCGGVLSPNHDGIPEVWCSAYDSGEKLECDECAAAPRCTWCGDRLGESETVTRDDLWAYHVGCAAELDASRTLEMA